MVVNSYHVDTIPVVNTPCTVSSCNSCATHQFSTGGVGRAYCWTHLPTTGKLLTTPDTPQSVWSDRGGTQTRVLYVVDDEGRPSWFERVLSADSEHAYIDIRYTYNHDRLDVMLHGYGDITTLATETVPITEYRGELPIVEGSALRDWFQDMAPVDRFAGQLRPRPHAIQPAD